MRFGPRNAGPTERAETMEGGGEPEDEEAASLLARLFATADSRAWGERRPGKPWRPKWERCEGGGGGGGTLMDDSAAAATAAAA